MPDEHQINLLLERIQSLSQANEMQRKEINSLKEEVVRLQPNQPPVANKPTNIPRIQKSIPGLENFIGLRLIHFAGIITLIIGLTIGVKYAIDANLISPFLRIALTYVAAIILFLLSLKLRRRYELFSIILFSGSMASAYFTTYAAFEYYTLLSQPVAFVLMLLFTCFTVFASLKYNRQEIAILGLVGAYGIPFFVKGNHENVPVLFSYIFIINAGVLLISFRKYWLSLSYLAFFTTWMIYLSWLFTHFGSIPYNTGIVFCFAFFLLFLFNCLAFKTMKRQTFNLSDTFVVAADTLFLYISLLVLHHSAHAAENITLMFGIVYLMAAVSVKTLSTLQEHFSNALFSIAFIALVAFIPLKLDGLTVTILWVLMAVALFVTGMLSKLKFFRIAAIVLFGGTLAKLILIDSDGFSAGEKVIAYIFTGTILLVVSFLYQKFKERIFGEGD